MAAAQAEGLPSTRRTWTAAALDEVVKQVSEKLKVGMGKVAQPVRVRPAQQRQAQAQPEWERRRALR